LGARWGSGSQGRRGNAAEPELPTIDSLFHVIVPLFRAKGL
jgi:hypothetical protein